MHKRKKVKHSDIMTIKRDKFQNIIRILELDIFNDCHLSWARCVVYKQLVFICTCRLDILR